jgi:hypothetical protein
MSTGTASAVIRRAAQSPVNRGVGGAVNRSADVAVRWVPGPDTIGRPLRARIAAAARAYGRHGWSVAPGTWWEPRADRYGCGRPCCTIRSAHPVDLTGMTPDHPGVPFAGRCRVSADRYSSADPRRLDRIWAEDPYTLLLPTGAVATVIDAPHPIARAAAARLLRDGQAAPIAVAVRGRLQLFAGPAPDNVIPQQEVSGAGVLLHGPGSWVAHPPSTLRTGPVRWVRTPTDVGWTLPPFDQAVDALQRAVEAA